MKAFQDMQYTRPNLDDVEAKARELVAQIRTTNDVSSALQAVNELNALRQQTATQFTLSHIRNSIDSLDPFYKDEKQFSDKNQPRMQAITSDYYRALLDAPVRAELEQELGTLLFRKAELAIKTFSPDIVEELGRENELYTTYSDITSTAQIEFHGETYNLSQMGKFMSSADRDTRKEASKAVSTYMAQYGDRIDNIYDEQVKVRTQIAKKLGYENFVQLAYDRLGRTDYTADMVANFRAQVKRYIVPLTTKLREEQRKRIGVDTLYHFDEPFHFATGNPIPKGTPEELVQKASSMYNELSPETGVFFQFMMDHNLLDLVAKKGKRPGGYCTSIETEHAPFIFSNFNGTLGDVIVLTHEAGHAFMFYQVRNNTVPEYQLPTLEAAEIHSHSMELLTWPWMDSFFEDEADKYRFVNLSGNIFLLASCCLGDEFQHWVYENPDATPAQRRAKWRSLEREYLPYRTYLDDDYLESGTTWHRVLHFFMRPFYYIDYALAVTCAQQFWTKSLANKDETWADYLHLCQLGGSQSFLQLVKEAKLQSPFEDGCMQMIIGDIENWFASVKPE